MAVIAVARARSVLNANAAAWLARQSRQMHARYAVIIDAESRHASRRDARLDCWRRLLLTPDGLPYRVQREWAAKGSICQRVSDCAGDGDPPWRLRDDRRPPCRVQPRSTDDFRSPHTRSCSVSCRLLVGRTTPPWTRRDFRRKAPAAGISRSPLGCDADHDLSDLPLAAAPPR
jgi:hypothetical protein